MMKTLVCVFLIFAYVIAVDTCIQGIVTQVNTGLQNGILPTHAANDVLNSQLIFKGYLYPNKLVLANNWTFNAENFVVETQEESIVSGVANNLTVQDIGQQDGQIVVQNMVLFGVTFSLKYENSTLYGVAVIPDCPLNYSFNISFLQAPNFYNLTMDTDNVTFSINQCPITQIIPNFPHTTVELASLMTQLNAKLTTQTSLQRYYSNFQQKMVNYVEASIPTQIQQVDFEVSNSNGQNSIMVTPNMINFTLLYNNTQQTLQYQVAFEVSPVSGKTQKPIEKPVCEPKITIPVFGTLTSKNQSEFYSLTFLQNMFNILQGDSILGSQLNGTNWPVPYLSWFTGGWADINQNIYLQSPLDEAITGSCVAQNAIMIPPTSSATINNFLYFDLQYVCQISAQNGKNPKTGESNTTLSMNINLTNLPIGVKFIQVDKYNYDLQLVKKVLNNQYIADVSNYTTLPALSSLNSISQWYLNSAIAMLNGTSFGLPIPTVVNQAPINYQFDQYGLWVYPSNTTKPTV